MEQLTINKLPQQLKVGDILLCSGSSFISNLIKKATDSVYSHVGLILKQDLTNTWLVLESVESIGVRCVTLEYGYLKNYDGSGKAYPGNIYTARHDAMPVEQSSLIKLYATAFNLLGSKYSQEDILRIAARILNHDLWLPKESDLSPNREFICSEYVDICFKSCGINLKDNSLGFISPKDVASDPNVEIMYELKVPERAALPLASVR